MRRTIDAMTDSLRFELVSPTTVRAGAPVPVTLRFTNVADHPITVSVMGRRIAFDIVVRRADGVVVWRRLEGQTVPAILQIRTIAPGATLELRDLWRQHDRTGIPVAPGGYTLQGVVPTDAPQPLETPIVPLRIEPD